MSAVCKLSSKMPGDPMTNGVDDQVAELLQEPDEVRVMLAWYDVSKVTHDVDSGEDVPTIRLRRVEPLGLVGDVDGGIAQAVQAAVEKRTGRKPIPFGIVEVDDDGAYGDPDQLGIDDAIEDDQ